MSSANSIAVTVRLYVPCGTYFGCDVETINVNSLFSSSSSVHQGFAEESGGDKQISKMSFRGVRTTLIGYMISSEPYISIG